MADEYISREAIQQALHSGDIDMGMVSPREYRLLRKLSKRIDAVIQQIPAADVKSVRHGRWLNCKPYNPEFNGYECSECGAKYQGFSPDNYCPNCGAKMDGSEA